MIKPPLNHLDPFRTSETEVLGLAQCHGSRAAVVGVPHVVTTDTPATAGGWGTPKESNSWDIEKEVS